MGILVENRLVAAHPGEMVDVAGLGHADDGMDQKVGLRLSRRAEGQLLVRAVKRVAGLERNDAAPAKLAEAGAELVWGVAAGLEVVVHGRLDAGDGAADVHRLGHLVQIADRRVGAVVGAVDALGLAGLVRRPLVGDGQRREDHALGVAQRDVLPRLDAFGELFRNVERHGHRPERTVGEAHVFDHAVVVGLSEKTLERKEAAVHQQLQIADLALGEVPRRQVRGLGLELLRALPAHVEFGDRSMGLRGRHRLTRGHVHRCGSCIA